MGEDIKSNICDTHKHAHPGLLAYYTNIIGINIYEGYVVIIRPLEPDASALEYVNITHYPAHVHPFTGSVSERQVQGISQREPNWKRRLSIKM